MKNIFIGHNANGQRLFLTPEMREETHVHVLGGTRTGKSKFLEHVIREDIKAGHGVCLIDWHGTLFMDVLRWCAYNEIGIGDDYREVIIIDPTQNDWVKPIDFFSKRGLDVSTQVDRRISVTLKAWGERNADTMPTFERVCRLLFTFAVEREETLVNAVHLLDFNRPELREMAAAASTDGWIQSQWASMLGIKTTREWNELTLSSVNRFARFTGSTIKRLIGLRENCLSIREKLGRGSIIFVNLADSDFLSRVRASLLGALLLNEFFEAAMQRANDLEAGETARPYMLVLDEFQEFITDDLAAMLDQVAKGGLRLILAHQHLGHFADNSRLAKAVFTNARIRAVFGGLDHEDACIIGKEMFLDDLNRRQIKKAIWHTTHVYEEQTRIVRGSSGSTTIGSGWGSNRQWQSGAGSGTGAGHAEGSISPVEGWFPSEGDPTTRTSSQFSTSSDFASEAEGGSETENEFESGTVGWSEIITPVWVPIPQRELTSETEWTPEEKLLKIVQLLKEQLPRHCFVKSVREQTQPLLVPFVRERLIDRDRLLNYTEQLNRRQQSFSGPEADQLLLERECKFLNQAWNHASVEPEVRPGVEVPLRRRRG